MRTESLVMFDGLREQKVFFLTKQKNIDHNVNALPQF